LTKNELIVNIITSCFQKGDFEMENITENQLAQDLEFRIASHISRGNLKALNIITEYHMEEVRQIRDYMLSFVKDNVNNPWALNQYFHMAVAELKINLVDLLVPGTKVVSSKEESLRIAM
jgi:hypothetical protein